MKALHRPDLFCWSAFDEARNIDFNSFLWVQKEGNVVFDPLPQSPHDRAHLMALGGAAWIVVSNADHLRDTLDLATATGAKIAAPAAERATFDLVADRWLADGDELVDGLAMFAMNGSKTPGELAFVLDSDTLITGDLIRAHRAGTLMILPDAKLTDRALAEASVRRLAAIGSVRTVLVGDGWPVFWRGREALDALVASFD